MTTVLKSFGKKRNKYGAKPTYVDGIRFHSKSEAQRYGKLRQAEIAGEITALQLQPKFPIYINGVECGTYIADFQYNDKAGERVIEDVKGARTALYIFKKRVVEAAFGITVTEVVAQAGDR